MLLFQVRRDLLLTNSPLSFSLYFLGDVDPTYLLAVSGTNYRQVLLLLLLLLLILFFIYFLLQGVIRGEKRRGDRDEVEIAASLEIQRIWRGHHTRMKIRELFARSGNKVRPIINIILGKLKIF